MRVFIRTFSFYLFLTFSLLCYLLILNGLIGSVIAEVMWLYGVLYTSSLIGTMALTLQIPLSIIADSFVRGAQYSPMFNIGAACIFAAFIFVNLATLSSMPKNKIKVPRKVRHFCCCTVIEKVEEK